MDKDEALRSPATGDLGNMRPRRCRRVAFQPDVRFFKPRGVPLRLLEVVELRPEEVEALRLKHIEHLDQIEAAGRMETSQSTYQRILLSAHEKVTKAIICGQAIRLG